MKVAYLLGSLNRGGTETLVLDVFKKASQAPFQVVGIHRKGGAYLPGFKATGEKMIEQAKAAINSEKNAAMAELKNQVSSLSLEIAEKVLRDELSNKEAQSKLVEKMLGDAKLN